MKKLLLSFTIVLFFFTSCKKAIENVKERFSGTSTSQFIDHLIPAGTHNSDKSTYKAFNGTAMNFIVKFDNSAIYQTTTEANQQDINKLYGFSDNNQDHHTSSARIGWRWYNNSLVLFAYVYNNGIVSSKEITQIPLNQEINCSIKIQSSQYLFNVNGVSATMPRGATTETGIGYQLYPYFGGDEAAPHDIHIQIKDVAN